MDVDAEAQVRARRPGRVEESQKEPDQGGVAVGEDDAVAAPVRLALRAFAPVGDGAGDEELAIGQLADLGRGRFTGRGTPGLAGGALGGPVAAGAFGRTLPALRVAQPGWRGQVPDPEGDGVPAASDRRLAGIMGYS